jgi:hypothetical protein
VVTKPTGTADLDVMDVWIGYLDIPFDTTITPPAGWTQRFATDDGAETGFKFACFTKTASSEGASWTWTLSAAADHIWAAHAAAGGTGSLTGTASGIGRAGGASTYTSPSITPGANGALIRAGFFTDTNSSRTITPDSSPVATEEIELIANDNQHIYTERYEQTTAAAQALDMTYSSTVAQQTLTGIIAWAPSVGSGNTYTKTGLAVIGP